MRFLVIHSVQQAAQLYSHLQLACMPIGGCFFCTASLFPRPPTPCGGWLAISEAGYSSLAIFCCFLTRSLFAGRPSIGLLLASSTASLFPGIPGDICCAASLFPAGGSNMIRTAPLSPEIPIVAAGSSQLVH